MAAVLIVLLYAFFVFSGAGAAERISAARPTVPWPSVPLAPCRVMVRYAVHSVPPAERLERRQMERPVVWLTRAQTAPLALMDLNAAPLCAVLRDASALLCGSHPQRAPPLRA